MTGRTGLLQPWVWKMAWRDSRRSRRRLLLFSTCIVMGVAALVAIGSFGRALRAAIVQQAKSLLGADLEIGTRQPLSSDAEAFLRSLGGQHAREISFASMIQFPKSRGTRLAQVRALQGGFPFYGTMETEPAEAEAQFRKGGGALVEESLLTQFGAAVGDPIKVGELTIPIAGMLKRVPGETLAFATFAPRVYIPLTDVGRTQLLQFGSLARYRTYFKFEPGTNVGRLMQEHQAQLRKFRMRHETVQRRTEELGNAVDNAYHFLNLVGFVSLLLGGIGIASAIHVHIKQRLGTVAILRCLGGSVRQTFTIYIIQGMALGLIGAVLGAVIGLGIQRLLPSIVRSFLPFPVAWSISWTVLLQAMVVGFTICLLFTLLPLLSVRRVSPLAALRSVDTIVSSRWKDPLIWLVYLLIAAGTVAFAVLQTRRWSQGLGLALGLAVAFTLLAMVAKLIAVSARKLVAPHWPYVIRQGVANLYRPNNRTVLLMLSLGLGIFLILTLFFIHETLLGQLSTTRLGNHPNTILFDIQPDQRESVAALVHSLHLDVIEQAPIVTMRLLSIKGQMVEQMESGMRRSRPAWALRREYRSTYRDYLTETETLVAGKWPVPKASANATVPISIEEGIAKDLGVKMGDEVVFDVQGVPISTRVASVRKVEWRRVRPNFFVVFPTGVLEKAPAIYAMATRVDSAQLSATLHREVVRQFPNVSVIDLTLIIKTVDAIVSKIASVIRFMAMFTVVTGLLVLIAAISTGRYQRLQESMLLRTLGASRRQILTILATEYVCLGLFASLTGIVLALGASWALSTYVLKLPLVPALTPTLIALVVTAATTVLAGLLGSRGICDHPPLEILRSDL
jgi:putative ABC transport system permease protein